MQFGMIGLGRMGANMVRRLLTHGHECVAYDLRPQAVAAMQEHGASSAATLADLVAQIARPRVIWLMLPAVLVDGALDDLAPCLAPGDILVDGGNSYYRDDIRRAAKLVACGQHYMDVGVSGGIAGYERGYCLMIGGEPEVVERLTPLFVALAPGVDAAPRSPGRGVAVASVEHGYLHCGPSDAGHFVKMVHNGIEYRLMAAYAEGFNILRNANVGKEARTVDAETAPLRHPEFYQYDLNLPDIAELWRRGSVIGSWLLDLTAPALMGDATLAAYGGRVADSGEERWALEAAMDEIVPTHVLSAALFERFASRGNSDYASQLLSAMRHEFGGHLEKPPEQGK